MLAASGLSRRLFQSTHPVRGATRADGLRVGAHDISIHAPREGCDMLSASGCKVFSIFQSTHPVRGATGGLQYAHGPSLYFNPRTP